MSELTYRKEEIDRLRAELETAKCQIAHWRAELDSFIVLRTHAWSDLVDKKEAELDRLRAELARYGDGPCPQCTQRAGDNADLRAEIERLRICVAARDELLAVKDRPSPEGLSREEKLIWQLGNLMDNVENFYGAPNLKREGHIYSTAVRILDELAPPAPDAGG